MGLNAMTIYFGRIFQKKNVLPATHCWRNTYFPGWVYPEKNERQ